MQQQKATAPFLHRCLGFLCLILLPTKMSLFFLDVLFYFVSSTKVQLSIDVWFYLIVFYPYLGKSPMLNNIFSTHRVWLVQRQTCQRHSVTIQELDFLGVCF